MLQLFVCLLLAGSAFAQAPEAVNPMLAAIKEKVDKATATAVTLEGGNGEGKETTKSFTVETGASSGDLKLLNDIPPCAGAIIFESNILGADGKIAIWQFYSYGAGDVCFGLFKRSTGKSDGKVYFESAGRNCLTVNSAVAGLQEVEIPSEQQLSCTTDHVVALYYPAKTCDLSRHVVTMQTNRYTDDGTLGDVTVLPMGDIQPGAYFESTSLMINKGTTEVALKGRPSFKAVVFGMSKVLELRNGPDGQSGVAMIFMDNVWGTMCDRWYHEKGWPYLFCAELDFPDTDHIAYTDTPERFQVSADTPIHLRNPRCKFSENVTMFSCATHDNVTCNHTNDLFIRCKSKVDFRKSHGSIPSEGVPYIYESNYWGTICDKRPLPQESGLDHIPSDSYAHVVCKARGFPAGALKITRLADEGMVTEDQSITHGDPVSMHSPVCTGGAHSADIRMCKDGPIDLRCNHTMDVYIRCVTTSSVVTTLAP